MTRKRVAGALLAVMLALHVVATVQRADREPHPDETEYLHAAWLMAKGEQLFVDFFEHHPPFLFGALRLVAGDDVPQYFVRARLLSGVFSLIALAALAAIVWRIRPESAPLAIAFMLASLPMWTIGLAAARAEPFALAFFWTGVALILLPRGDERVAAIAGGIGIACVFIAALWNPKWPFCSVVVAAFWIARTPQRALSAAVAAWIALVALGVLRAFATFDQLWFFIVEFNRANYPSVGQMKVHWGAQGPLTFAPLLLRPWAVGAALLLAAAAVIANRARERAIVVALILIAIASAIELRVVFPYPVLWNHYFLMWSFAGAALIAIAPAILESFSKHLGTLAWAAIAVIVVIHLATLAPVGTHSDDGPYWMHQRWLARHVRPGDRVLIDILRHPVSVRDSTYYWFGVVPVIDELRRTPRGARYLPPPQELPFCAILAGGKPPLRYVSSPRLFAAPAHQQRCFQELLASGRMRRASVPEVFEVLH